MSTTYPPFNIEPVKAENHLVSIAIEGDSDGPAISGDYIRVHSIQGQESISQPFQFSVELRADDTSDAGLLMDGRYLGQWANIKIMMPEKGSFSPRYIRGLITELAVGAPGIYTLSLQSPLHLLTLRNDYHIYSSCDIRELITQILSQELADTCFSLRFDFSKSPTLTRIQDWMQAGEPSFNLLQRILAKAFINFYFIHEQNHLTLVFTDKPVTPDTVSIPGFNQGPLPLRYTFTSIDPLKSKQYDVFAELRFSMKMMPGNVKTLLNQIDPEWKDNTVASYHSYAAQQNHTTNNKYYHQWNYDYGVNDSEAKDQLVKICQQIQTETGTLSGKVFTPLLSPGYCFQLEDPLMSEEKVEGKGRPEFTGKIYVVTQVKHQMSQESGYEGSIEATEVIVSENEEEHTLLTPFNMQATQQGSVLAKVVDHQKPVGWRYRSKNNFQPEKGQVFFEGEMTFQGECYGEAGCLVELATGQRHWVVLPRSSQSVPEINAMVMVGRGSNESEQPELQQIIASHGSKVIQPPDRRSASWQANTSWGSNYSTSYGDGISIHYSHNAQTDLPKAIRLVEGAYDYTGMKATNYSSCSYNKSSSWSVSLSENQDNPDEGVIGASISQGSNFNESHVAHSYSYGSVNLSEGYSETGKSANVSIVGKYTPDPDLDSPSFVNGKLPKDISQYSGKLQTGDTFSRSSVLGRSISCNGVGVSAPDVNIDTILPMSHYNANFTLGLSENYSTTIGATQSNSLMVGLTTNNNITCAGQLNTSLTIGPMVNMDTRITSVDSLSTTIGPNTSISTQIADNLNLGTTIGSNTNIQTNLTNNTSLNTTIGTTNDLSTYIGERNSINTFVGGSNDVAVSVADKTSTNVSVGTSTDTSVNVAARKSTNIFVGATDDLSVNIAARKSTQINLSASDETAINLSASKSQSFSLALKDETSINLAASSTLSLSLGASMSIDTSLAASIAMKNSMSASVELINSLSASAKIVNQASADFEMVNGLTKAEMDMRQQAKLRATIAEVIAGMDVKV